MSARRSILPVFIPHLGCPHDCVFCNQKRISGSLFPAGAEDVYRAAEQGGSCGGETPQLAFYGGSFTAIPAEEQLALLKAGKACIDRGLVSDIRLSTRPDAIDEIILDRLKAYGVSTVELGTQSMIDSVLDKSGRGHTSAQTERASKLVKEWGFTLILQMMTGLPGSSDELDIRTAEKIVDIKPDGVRVYPTVIIRDTALYELWQAGLYQEHTVEDAVRVGAEILPIFDRAGINVIRFGLNPTDDLSGGDAVGGAYHPALGELVKSRVLLNDLRGKLSGRYDGETLTVAVAEGCTSQMAGQHRCNIDALKSEYGFSAVKIREKALERGKTELVSVAK